MRCAEFEERLTDYIEGALAAEANQAMAQHALSCPVCHDLLNEVRNAMEACRSLPVAEPPLGLEARIIARTVPEAVMTCEEFEEHLTDYLDGFLPAPLYHRWERHAALCPRCTDLPGDVVRAIGACYSLLTEELPVPADLHSRILCATLGAADAHAFRPSLVLRLRAWLEALWGELQAVTISPQLATVAVVLLVAVLIGSTLSKDGTIGDVYRTSWRLAAQTYALGANTAARMTTGDLKKVTGAINGT
jgi:anti-sigma factor RsiW